jgi:O-antigen biosynthesis protein WbqP
MQILIKDISNGNGNYYRMYGKRLFDMLLALLVLIILSPIFLIILLAIKVDDPGPALFKQKRVGANKTLFNMYKFRSMKQNTPKDIPTHLLENPDQYITRVGRILRRTSLDELPQIGQILTGKMSVVGPRPALWNQYDLLLERDKYGANDIRPGLTGMAQIGGRDELEIPQKAKIDGEYAKNISLHNDIICICKTILYVAQRKGVVEGKVYKTKLSIHIHGDEKK